ncbi:hypothetical protein ACCS42_09185 [Rhizobium ruizarguesonis]
MEISNFYIFVIFALVIALLAAVIQIFKSRQNKDRVFYTEEERRIFVATKKMMPVFAIALVIFFISALLWSFGAAFRPRDTSIFSIFHPSVVPMAAGRSGISWNNFFTNIGTLMFVGCGSVGIGAILGFLFGVPRTLEAANRAALADGKRSEAATQATLAANTNLERVSDWLTTLLIGAAIVNFSSIWSALEKIGTTLFSADPSASYGAIAAAAILYGLVVGFLGAYLITRLYLTYAFRETLWMLTGIRDDTVQVDAVIDYAFATRTMLAVDSAVVAMRQMGPNLAANPLAQARFARLLGLQYQLKSADSPSDDTLAKIRADALQAVRFAARDPNVRRDLVPQLDKTQAELPFGQQDLVGFSDDPEFRAELGLQTPTEPQPAPAKPTEGGKDNAAADGLNGATDGDKPL